MFNTDYRSINILCLTVLTKLVGLLLKLVKSSTCEELHINLIQGNYHSLSFEAIYFGR